MSAPVHRILREGSEVADFNHRLEILKDDDLRRRKILEEICARLDFEEHVKYRSSLLARLDRPSALDLQDQINRLITYLALTSLDIIAREEFNDHEFLDFPSWFFSMLKSTTPPSQVTRMVTALSNVGPTSPRNVLLKQFPAIERAYHNREGVYHPFKRLLRKCVAPWLQEWLCSEISVEKNTSLPDLIEGSSLSWAHLSLPKRMSRISEYLWYLRCQYTHTSGYADTQELGPFRAPDPDSPAYSIRFFDVPDSSADKVKWTVVFPSGFSESEVIRMISVHLLRKWLQYQDGPDFPETYLWRLTFRFHANSLSQELANNSSIIARWAFIESRATLIGIRDLPSLLLATRSATSLVQHTSSQPRYRQALVDELPRYLELTSQLNGCIRDHFTTITPTEDQGEADDAIRNQLRDLSRSPEALNIFRTIDRLTQMLEQTLETPFY